MFISACDASPSNPTPGPTQTPKVITETYYNGVFDIKVEVPEGWHIGVVSLTNMSREPGKPNSADDLEITAYDGTGSGIQMIELWNRSDSANKEHASFYAYVELYPELNLESYLETLESEYTGTFGDIESTLATKDTLDMSGVTYSRLILDSAITGSTDLYHEQYLVKQLDEGKFLVLCTTYWNGNDISTAEAAEILNYVTVSQ